MYPSIVPLGPAESFLMRSSSCVQTDESSLETVTLGAVHVVAEGEGVDAEAALSEAVAVGEQGFPETASLAELAAKARGVVVTLDEPVIRQRVATVRETLSHLGE